MDTTTLREIAAEAQVLALDAAASVLLNDAHACAIQARGAQSRKEGPAVAFYRGCERGVRQSIMRIRSRAKAIRKMAGLPEPKKSR